MRLGRIPDREAERLRDKVTQLEVAAKHGQPVDAELAAWARKLPDQTHAKLASAGLLPTRDQPERQTLGTWLDAYAKLRSDMKPSTATIFGPTRRCLLGYFGAGKPLRSITSGDADAWRIWLAEHEKLGTNTVKRRCGIAKQFFRAAQRRRLIESNPFGDMKGIATQRNPDRHFFIMPADAQKVLDACPDTQWRLLFALSRFGGLPCPSEHLGLRWADVDWDRGRMLVRPPKTAHHEGKGERWVPLFPELRPHLETAWDEAEPGTEYVITRYRNSNANLRTHLERIIRRAGLTPWPKLFQNLRSTRETELAENFPLHVVCAWIGNTQSVAVQHYLQVTDEHFEQASQRADGTRNGTQHGDAAMSTGSRASQAGYEKTPVLPGFSAQCEGMREAE
jgi:integrase